MMPKYLTLSNFCIKSYNKSYNSVVKKSPNCHIFNS